MRLIVTRPRHDIPTIYLSAWAEEIIDLAKGKNIIVTDLLDDKANREELEGRIKKLEPECLFFNGHGDDNYIAGHDNKALVKTGDNHKILEGRITYALACRSGKALGPKITENTDTTYIGYVDDFIFVSDNNHVTKPLTDPNAHPFMKSSNQVMVSLLKGHTAREASERSKNAFKEHYTKLLASGVDPESSQAAKYLWWNMRNQVCLGNGEARL